MSQQVFDKYWPVGNADEETAIPGSAILQTRDDKDEPITLAGNMVWDSGNSLWVPVSQSNPLEARVRQLETLIGALDASKETDPDAASAALLALIRGLMSLVAKEATLGDVKTAVESIAGEDFATQTTLAAILGKLDDPATETTQGAVKTAVEALAALISDGALKTTLSGRNVVIHTLVDAVEIRDTNSFSGGTVAGSTLRAYKDLDLFAIDSHNQPIQLVFTSSLDPGFTGSHYRVRGESDWSARPVTITDANSLNRPLVLRSDANIGAFLASRVWAVAGIGVRVGIPGSAPESGALTVVAIGVIN